MFKTYVYSQVPLANDDFSFNRLTDDVIHNGNKIL